MLFQNGYSSGKGLLKIKEKPVHTEDRMIVIIEFGDTECRENILIGSQQLLFKNANFSLFLV